MSVLDRLPRAAIFDWDNTLVDTWPVIHESMNATLYARYIVEAAMEQPFSQPYAWLT